MKTETNEKTVTTECVIGYLKKVVEDNPGYNLYMIVDTAQDESIYPMLMGSGVKMECLFMKGVHYPGEAMTEMLKTTVPYLITLDIVSPFLIEIVKKGWTKNWFTIALSNKEFDRVKEHCSDILLARTEDGDTFQFRWYDPRILRAYLPVCTSEELKEFCGPVEVFCVDDEESGEPVVFTYKNQETKS